VYKRQLSALEFDPALTANTDLTAEIDASPTEEGSRSRVIVRGETGATRLSLRGGLTGNIAEPDTLMVDLSLDVSNDDPNTFIRQIGGMELGFDPLMGGIGGPLQLTLESMGNGVAGYSTVLSANVPDTSVAAKGIVRRSDEALQMDFDTTIGSADISPFVLAFGYRIPGLDPLLDSAAPLSYEGKISRNKDGTAQVEIENGQLSGNTVSGKIGYEGGLNGRPIISGELAVDEFPIPLIPALAFGVVDPFGKTGTLGSGWTSDEFTGPAFSGVDARIDITANSLSTGTVEPGNNGALKLEMNDGSLSVSNFSMDWIGGSLTGSGTLKSNEGTGLLQMQYAANGLDAVRLISILGTSPVFGGSLDLSGSLDGTGKSAKAMIASLSGGGIIKPINAAVEGIRVEGLDEILAASDGEGFKIDAASVGPLVRRQFLQGSIDIQDSTIPFSLGKGQVQFRNVPFGRKTDDPVANGEFDLIEGAAVADIRIMPDPGLDKVAGATPEVTFLFAGYPGEMNIEADSKAMEGFLAIRAFEREQRRVELLQASILEKQRIRFEVLQSNEQEKFLESLRQAEIRRLEEEQRALEEERKRKEAERLEAERKAAEEAARLEAERKAAEEAARLEEERKAVEEAARLEAERKAAEEAARLEAERKAAEEAARLEAERKAAEEAARLEEERKAAEEAANKSDIEIQPLDAPMDIIPDGGETPQENPIVKRNLFQDIEKLLFE